MDVLSGKSGAAAAAAAFNTVTGDPGRPGVMTMNANLKTPDETVGVQFANKLLRDVYAKLPKGSTLADVLAKMVELAPSYKADTAKALAALNALTTSADTGRGAAAVTPTAAVPTAAAPTAAVTPTAAVPTAAAPTAAAPTAAVPTAAAPTAAAPTAVLFDLVLIAAIIAAFPKQCRLTLDLLFRLLGMVASGASHDVVIAEILSLATKFRATLSPSSIFRILKTLGVRVQFDAVIAACTAGVAAGKYHSAVVPVNNGVTITVYGIKLSDRKQSDRNRSGRSAPRSSGGGSYARPRDTTAGSGGGGAENAAIDAATAAIKAENEAIEDAITGPIGAVTLPDGPLDHLATDPDPSDDDDDINAQLFGSSTNAFAFPDTVSDAASGGGADAAASQ